MVRVLFVTIGAALLLLLGHADATSLSRTYLPPQVQVQHIVSRPQVVQVVQQRPVIQSVVVPQRTYLPPAPRVVSVQRPAPVQVISIPRPVQHQIISRPQVQVVHQRPVVLPQRTYLPPAPSVLSIARPAPQVIAIAAPRRTYLPPQGAASSLSEQYEQPEEI